MSNNAYCGFIIDPPFLHKNSATLSKLKMRKNKKKLLFSLYLLFFLICKMQHFQLLCKPSSAWSGLKCGNTFTKKLLLMFSGVHEDDGTAQLVTLGCLVYQVLHFLVDHVGHHDHLPDDEHRRGASHRKDRSINYLPVSVVFLHGNHCLLFSC